MILSDIDITDAIASGLIKIDPFDPACLGPNSYDVHLSPYLATYELAVVETDPNALEIYRALRMGKIHGLDCKTRHEVREHTIDPRRGFLLQPGRLYLASTVEYTESHAHVPYLDGKSSIGRLGIFTHVTAGRGDIGFCGHFTMEIVVVHPVRVYAGMPIGQLTYHMALSPPSKKYGTTSVAKYNNRDPKPQPSRMWKNFTKET